MIPSRTMSIGETDISWQVLREIAARCFGASAELGEVKPLVGGCINTTLALLTRDGSRAVLKISPHRVNRGYVHEAHQLGVLRAAGFPVPEVYLVETGSLEHPFSYIVLEFIEGVDLGHARRECDTTAYEHLQQRLAAMVAALHDHAAEAYQRVLPAGEAQPFASWPAFYRQVYDPIWHEAERSPHLGVKCRKHIGRVHERLERVLAHDDVPRLVHWDIWSTNVLVRPDDEGEWRVSGLLDPNCKYAHAEAEIAYMELFHTVTPAFLKAYQQRHKLPAEYHRFRKPVYQLYPLLNHFCLFGQEYAKPLQEAAERAAALV